MDSRKERTRVDASSRAVNSPPPVTSGLSDAATDISREQIGNVRSLFRKPLDVVARDGSAPPPNAGARGRDISMGRVSSDAAGYDREES